MSEGPDAGIRQEDDWGEWAQVEEFEEDLFAEDLFERDLFEEDQFEGSDEDLGEVDGEEGRRRRNSAPNVFHGADCYYAVCLSNHFCRRPDCFLRYFGHLRNLETEGKINQIFVREKSGKQKFALLVEFLSFNNRRLYMRDFDVTGHGTSAALIRANFDLPPGPQGPTNWKLRLPTSHLVRLESNVPLVPNRMVLFLQRSLLKKDVVVCLLAEMGFTGICGIAEFANWNCSEEEGTGLKSFPIEGFNLFVIWTSDAGMNTDYREKILGAIGLMIYCKPGMAQGFRDCITEEALFQSGRMTRVIVNEERGKREWERFTCDSLTVHVTRTFDPPIGPFR